MKKILFVSNRLIGGGSERVLVALANAFAEKGYDTSILSYLDGDTYPISDKVQVYSLHGIGNKAKRILAIRRMLRQLRPDAVIAFEFFVNMQVILAHLGMRSRLIVSERNDPARRGGGFPNRYIRNVLYHFCHTLVCQTTDAKAYFPASVQKRAVIIPNPIKADLPPVWEGAHQSMVVNFCRLQKQKNLPLLVDAFGDFCGKHPEYAMTIYGDGEEKEGLEAYIRQQGLQDAVTLHESVPDVHRRIADSAMFVSSSDYEGLSNSMIEAMAMGLPTICTDCPVGGARMVIADGENGLLTPVGDRAALAAAMCRIAEDAELAAKLGSNGRKIRETLSIGDIADVWEGLLK